MVFCPALYANDESITLNMKLAQSYMELINESLLHGDSKRIIDNATKLQEILECFKKKNCSIYLTKEQEKLKIIIDDSISKLIFNVIKVKKFTIDNDIINATISWNKANLDCVRCHLLLNNVGNKVDNEKLENLKINGPK